MTSKFHFDKKKIKFSAQILLLCTCIAILNMGQGLILPVIGPLFLDKYHGLLPVDAPESARYFYYSAMLMSFSLGLLISAPIWGFLADKAGRKKMLLIGLFGTFITYGVTAISIHMQLIWPTLIARFFSAFFMESVVITTLIFIELGGEYNKARLLRLNRFALGIGVLLGPLAGGLWISHKEGIISPYARPFFFMSLNILFAILLIRFFLARDSRKPTAQKWLSLSTFQVFRDIFLLKSLWRLNTSLFFFGIGCFLFFLYMPFFLTQQMFFKPIDMTKYLVVLSIYYFIILLFIYPALVRHVAYYPLMFSSLSLGVSGFILMALTQLGIMVWVYSAFLLSTLAVIETTFLVHYSDTFSGKLHGLGIGMNSSVMAASMFISSLSIGLLGFINPRLPFYAGAFAWVLSLIILPHKKSS